MKRENRADCPAAETVGGQIVMTKWAGLQGTVELAERCRERLLERYPAYFIEEAKALKKYLPVEREMAAAEEAGVRAMCQVSESGVFGALWALAARAGIGLAVDLKAIPIRQETVEICNLLDINPYELPGGGSLLCLTKQGMELAARFRSLGIASEVIGYATADRDRVVTNGEERRFLTPCPKKEEDNVRFLTA